MRSLHAYSAHEKVQKHFGDLIKNVPLEEGVARMAAWAKKTGARQGKPFRASKSARTCRRPGRRSRARLPEFTDLLYEHPRR